MVYCISYDLRKPGREYDSLYEAIKSYGTWWHQTGSVWLIVTHQDAVQIRDDLKALMDFNDKLFVVALQREWAGAGFNQKEYDWLKSIPESEWN